MADPPFVPDAFALKAEELADTTALMFGRTSYEVFAPYWRNSAGIFIHGSAELARRLSDAGLIDRYNLLVFPVLLGAGKSIFSTSDRDKQSLALRDSAVYSNGVVKVIYDVVR